MHRIKEATCVALMLKADDQIVGVSHDDHVAPGLLPSPALNPKVEAVMQVDIGEDWRNHRPLACSRSSTVTTPSSSIPALSHFWTRRMMRLSPIRCSRKRTSPDFSKGWVHRSPGSEKIELLKGFISGPGGVRCRQSVARICLALHPSKVAKWWPRLTAAR